MKKFLRPLIFCFVVFCYCVLFMSFAIHAEESQLTGKTNKIERGYTKKFHLPEKGLTEEERKYLTVVMKVNDIFSEEDNVQVIMQKIEPLMTEIWGNLKNTTLWLDFKSESGPTRDKIKYVSFVRIHIPSGKPGIYPIGSRIIDRQICYFDIFGPVLADDVPAPSDISPRFQEKAVMRICLGITKEESPLLCVDFYDNGIIQRISYCNDELANVKREVIWSKNGELISERAIIKPEPLQFLRTK